MFFPIIDLNIILQRRLGSYVSKLGISAVRSKLQFRGPYFIPRPSSSTPASSYSLLGRRPN
jgi:hypothetical protein